MKVNLASRYLICFFVLAVQPAAFAQGDRFEAGYIITLTGDSLNGFILIQGKAGNSSSCGFKQSINSEVKTYSPYDLKAYGFGTERRYDSYGLSFDETTQNFFIKCLIKGKVSLYYFRERYFIDFGGGIKELVSTTTNTTRDGKSYSQQMPMYKGVLQKAMNDCPSIHENLKETALTKKHLDELFEVYHKCIGHPATFYNYGPGRIKVSIGIALTGQTTELEVQSDIVPVFTYFFNTETMTDFSLAPTFIAELYLSKSLGRFRVRTGLSYYTGNYDQYHEVTIGTRYDCQLQIDMARIELPVMLKYYPLKKVGFYVIAGLGFNATVKWQEKNTLIIPPSSIFSEHNFLENKSFFTNTMGGIGFDFPLMRRRIFIEGIYGKSQSVLTTVEQYQATSTGNLTSITFTTGIVF